MAAIETMVAKTVTDVTPQIFLILLIPGAALSSGYTRGIFDGILSSNKSEGGFDDGATRFVTAFICICNQC